MGRPRKPIQQLRLNPHTMRRLLGMLEAGPVEVPRFGTFSLVRIPPKRLYHNFSKRVRTIPGYRKVKFTQSKELKEIL